VGDIIQTLLLYIMATHSPKLGTTTLVTPEIQVFGGADARTDVPSTCSFCTHLATRLESKIASMTRARRHVPRGLVYDAHCARHDASTHSTRDADRVVTCPRLMAHRCETCGGHGHTRSRCAPCGYCGVIGHIHQECPKALVDDKAKGMTVVLKGVTKEFLARIHDLMKID